MPIIVALLSGWKSRAIPKSISLTCSVRRQHHVRRLQVAIDHRRLEIVQILERVENLQRDIDNLALGKFAAGVLELLLERDARR